MFEHRHQPLISHRRFIHRLLRSVATAVAVISVSLALGMLGYHFIAGFDWVDSFLNASMILSGMGEINNPTTRASKIFAGIYAMFAGIVFLTTVAILFAPIAHRAMHHFHWTGNQRGGSPAEDEGETSKAAPRRRKSN
jgi:TRAP-type C4-dicarboxylate transport system permease small subunit